MSARSSRMRRLAIGRLLAQYPDGTVPTAAIEDVARAMEISTRTVRRDIARGGLPPYTRPRYVASQSDVEAFFDARGRYRPAWELRCAADPLTPSRSTWTRALKRELSRHERVYARDGEVERRKHLLHVRHEATHRNVEWEADHKELDVLVITAKGQRPCKPWLTSFIDSHTRAVMGWALCATVPGTGEVLAALADAVTVRPGRGPFGGIPERVRTDNGRDFLAKDVTDVLQALGSVAMPTGTYAPHEKGKIERFHPDAGR